MSFGFNTWLRVLQVAPIPAVLYRDHQCRLCRSPQGSQQSGLGHHQLRAQCGGSIFIAGTGAIVTNRTLFHEARLADGMQPSNPLTPIT
jgi:DHA2 family multidrug resistance protein